MGKEAERNVKMQSILHHDEKVNLIPSNIELSGMEMKLVNAMSREFTMKSYLRELKKEYGNSGY